MRLVENTKCMGTGLHAIVCTRVRVYAKFEGYVERSAMWEVIAHVESRRPATCNRGNKSGMWGRATSWCSAAVTWGVAVTLARTE